MWDGMPAVGLLMALLWFFISIAVLVLIVLAVVWLARNVGSGGGGSAGAGYRTGGGHTPTGGAREALDLRYARGEIDREAYLQARRDLGDPLE